MINLVINKMRYIGRPVKIDYSPGVYVTEFDGWRGFGILFVLLAHYFPSYFIGSWVFMEMFFVMSGFLITGILLDSKPKPGYYRKFMGRRIVRVFPIYYLALFIIFFLIPSSWIDLSYYREKQLWFWLYGENWLYAIDGWPATKGLHHFWSLAIEEQFYIIWPLVVWVFSMKGLLRACIFLFLFSILFRNIGMNMGFVMPFPYVATFGRMEGLVLGSAIAVLLRTNKSWLEKYTFLITLISAAAVLIVFFVSGTMHFQNFAHYSLNYTLVDIFFAGMITLTLCSSELKRFKKFINKKFFREMGVLSYSLYIFHYPIQNIIELNFMERFQDMSNSYVIAKLLCVFLAVAITFPIVYLVHKKVEIPFWKLRKYF